MSQFRLNKILEEYFGFSSIEWGADLGSPSSRNTAFSANGKTFVLKRYGSAAQQQLSRLESLAACFEEHRFPAPVSLRNSAHQRHVVVDGIAYGVSERIHDRVLHREDLGPS